MYHIAYQVGSLIVFKGSVVPKAIEANIIAGNWADSGDGSTYYMDIVHNLGTVQMPQVQILGTSGNVTFVESMAVINATTLRLKVPKFPDCRFDGTIRVSKN